MVKFVQEPGIENIKGLTEDEAAERIKTEGYNELPASKKRTIIDISLEVLKEPMFLLLIAGGAIYLMIGDVEEALMLLVFVFVVIGITIYQEQKVERALEALKSLSSPRALVIRNGVAARIPGREVVRGDIIMLSEGDRVPADAVVLSCSNLLIDESLLTGESVPVRKVPCEKESVIERPGGDDLPFVYSSTLVVQGHGVAEVNKIGINTEIGKIGKALQTLEPEETPLQKETKKLVKIFAAAGMALCVLVIVIYSITRGNWLNGVLTGITLAMALIPEEIPVVLTIFLALGAWRMSKRRVLTRQLRSIQTLGSTTVLSVDKTGTLTMNRMSLRKLYAQGKFFTIDENTASMPEPFHELMEYSILASQHDPFDPMEKAIKDVGNKILINTEHLHDSWILVQEYALSKKLLALSHVWRSPEGNEYVIAAKGAPEAIYDLCHMDDKKISELNSSVQEMAGEGLRVLGVARAVFKKSDLPTDQHEFNFEFIGLIGFYDPLRPGVANAVKECYEAGLRTIMITGDYPVTAQNIAKQAGISPCNEIITGIELEKMGDDELKRRIGNVNVFARVVPEQKLRIVEALKKNGEVVVMTGDGVNDAPALKNAHIGFAMGSRGTEVAREASSFVLLDDDFSSIVQAVKMGRRIFDNLKKAMSYIFAIHVPIAGMSLLPVLLGWPIMLFPAHIAFLELIIDPVCSIVFEAEPEEKDVMKRPPKKLNEPIFDKKMIFISILQGLVILAIVAAVYRGAPMLGESEEQARALAFTTLVIANLSLVFTNRSWSRTIPEMIRTPNKALLGVSIIALFFLALSLYVPFLSSIFQFGQLHLIDLVICAAASILGILWFEGLKIVNRQSR
ncbi:ATPase [Methanocella sp. CWC-04]|uniref:ATPase n=1 Tax=Methanooceanicella nereidis TaxID=2052831 RepID=A0AAP2RG00_9EURY|nr:cation-translocating P-type ATPase [Methanocella sp. CWC-04]MCD1295895.1 ATPase [Methanocella sp. CWC-04]